MEEPTPLTPSELRRALTDALEKALELVQRIPVPGPDDQLPPADE